ncbi:type II secretion system protein [Ideonella paludis]|uniref:type II secretion system protein n=1 Tax=Ideonella paludis TaxID=1233411 RepID=UPI00362CFF22
MVIVILGVLAAAALPKFMDLQRDARLAKLQALQGVLISSANQMRALCKLQYTQCGDAYGHITAMPNGQAPHVTMDGRDFGMQHGWPAPFDGYGLSSGYASFARALNLGASLSALMSAAPLRWSSKSPRRRTPPTAKSPIALGFGQRAIRRPMPSQTVAADRSAARQVLQSLSKPALGFTPARLKSSQCHPRCTGPDQSIEREVG